MTEVNQTGPIFRSPEEDDLRARAQSNKQQRLSQHSPTTEPKEDPSENAFYGKRDQYMI